MRHSPLASAFCFLSVCSSGCSWAAPEPSSTEAVKIAMTGAKATPSQFDPVEEKADSLQDWFTLKGFDNFQVPAGIAQSRCCWRSDRSLSITSRSHKSLAPRMLCISTAFPHNRLGSTLFRRDPGASRSLIARSSPSARKRVCAFLLHSAARNRDMKGLLAEHGGALR